MPPSKKRSDAFGACGPSRHPSTHAHILEKCARSSSRHDGAYVISAHKFGCGFTPSSPPATRRTCPLRFGADHAPSTTPSGLVASVFGGRSGGGESGHHAHTRDEEKNALSRYTHGSPSFVCLRTTKNAVLLVARGGRSVLADDLGHPAQGGIGVVTEALAFAIHCSVFGRSGVVAQTVPHRRRKGSVGA
jgi:hypothetical protein